MRRMSRLGLWMLALLTAVAGLQIGLTGTASADQKPIAITGNVYIHSSPDSSAASRLTVMPKGSHPDYVCYTRAEPVGGTNVWFLVNYNGTRGYYTSYWDDVPLAAQSNLEGNYGIHYCGTGDEMNQGVGANGTINPPPSTPFTYDRNASVGWALAHAQDEQALDWSQCAWFVSKALWAGGYAQNSDWNGQGSHGNHIKVPGTVTATGAPNLVDYLENMGWATPVQLGSSSFRGNQVPAARPGDIIAYKWYGGNTNASINHLALVVDIASGNYPEVAEWGTADFSVHGFKPEKVSTYQKRGWTWSENHHAWLQQVYPSVTAVLLRMKG